MSRYIAIFFCHRCKILHKKGLPGRSGPWVGPRIFAAFCEPHTAKIVRYSFPNRRRSDSNRRITVLQTVALVLLATPPLRTPRFSLQGFCAYCNEIQSCFWTRGRGIFLQEFGVQKRLILRWPGRFKDGLRLCSPCMFRYYRNLCWATDGFGVRVMALRAAEQRFRLFFSKFL